MIPIRDTPSGATFHVKVHPRAKKNAITGEVGDALKLALDRASGGRPRQSGLH